ncbi:hypothetical protein N7494_005477 [Penicillium frequentans]|uniref:Uncharacterized protein n=1 Tax=Penicillium frequentans TaxID=3151616 RepID=A0AAD6CY69_9EURO|nr:hypothetical protein N7494_005477 [Penicillium glabrum]
MACAATNGHQAVVKLLLGVRKADREFKDTKGRTVLFLAIEKGRKTLMKLFNTGKVNVDLKDPEGRTALSWAAANGQVALVKLLREFHPADVTQRTTGARCLYPGPRRMGMRL